MWKPIGPVLVSPSLKNLFRFRTLRRIVPLLILKVLVKFRFVLLAMNIMITLLTLLLSPKNRRGI